MKDDFIANRKPKPLDDGKKPHCKIEGEGSLPSNMTYFRYVLRKYLLLVNS
jgi:hypothetical protein